MIEGLEGRQREVFDPEMMRKHDLPENVEQLAREIIGCAIEVHRGLGPGLLESLYETALVYELEKKGIPHRRQVDIVVPYKEIQLRGQRLDLLAGELIVIELKSVSALHDIHAATVLSYIRALNVPLGLLLNFNVLVLKSGGLRRVFNNRWTGLKQPTTAISPTLSPSNPSNSSKTSS